VKRKRPQKHGTFLGLSHLASTGEARGIPSTCELSYAITRASLAFSRLLSPSLAFSRCQRSRDVLDGRTFPIPNYPIIPIERCARAIRARLCISLNELCSALSCFMRVHARAPLLSFVNLSFSHERRSLSSPFIVSTCSAMRVYDLPRVSLTRAAMATIILKSSLISPSISGQRSGIGGETAFHFYGGLLD